ncbi:filamentous hemagglutinin N-terminal domain-containing protein [Inhella sp.]|uniref:two-partner secretion domain-containing protein n=1 Tax=Inhella sp. TaxID=1921806 RepID=UPI0035B42ECB
MTRCPFRTLALSAALTLAWPVAAQAQVAPIRTDGSAGPVVDIRGPLMLIPESLGKLQGANLFHSFQHFNIPTGETARFTVQSPGVAHVISRVTGGLPSFLDGSLELKAEQGSPGFYFINPAGVVFGSEARIDVPAGFHVSTAQQLQLADGSQWATTGGSSFSAAAPEAFGFLGGDRAAPIVLLPGAVLAPARQSPAQLVAGDIDFSAAQLVGTGNLRLAAVGDGAVVLPLSGALPGDLKGDIRLGEGSFVFAASIRDYATGPIQIAAGNLTLSGNSAVTSAVLEGGSGAAGDVDVRLRNKLWVTEDSYLSVNTDTAAAVGDLRISAATVEIDQLGRLNAYTAGGGRSGAILIDAREQVLIHDNGKVWSNAIAAGDASDIQIRAPRITLASFGSVAATTQDTGKGGSIRLEASDTLRLAPDGHVQAYSVGLGSTGAILLTGNDVVLERDSNVLSQAVGLGRQTGGVGIQGRRSLVLDGAQIATFGLQGAASADVLLAGTDITIQGKSEITAGSLDGTGSAGTVAILADNLLRVSGSDTRVSSNTHTEAAGGYILLAARELVIEDHALVRSATLSTGSGGYIDLRAQETLRLNSGASVTASTTGPGNAGLVKAEAKHIVLDGGARIVSSAYQDEETGSVASGMAGGVVLQAGESVRMVGGSFLDSSAFTPTSEAGAILVTAGRSIELSRSSMTSFTLGAGAAGKILLASEGQIALNEQSFVLTSTAGSGVAGEIGLAGSNISIKDSRVASSAVEGSRGNAASVILAAQGLILLDGGHVSSGTEGIGAGGSVDIGAGQFRMQGASTVDSEAGAQSSGQAGNVRIQALESIELRGQSLISIGSFATVANPSSLISTRLELSAPRISLLNSAAFSDSPGNVSASEVRVTAPLGIRLSESQISTRAMNGNGGPLSLSTDGRLELFKSQASTSVFGTQGNGGDVSVRAQILWLDNGFVQANSAAQGGQGGVVNLDVGAVVASGNRVTLGGQVPLAFAQPRQAYNAIQAVAPDGVNGTIQLANPLQDLSASLALLDARLPDPARLGQSPCDRRSGSSLALSGRGGLAGQALPGGPPGRPAHVLAGSCP